MSIDALTSFVQRPFNDAWPGDAKERLEALWKGDATRYPARTKDAVAIRAPEFRLSDGKENNVPFAALIHPSSATSGAYGGMSFVLFPVNDGPAMISLVVGTQGLSPDEEILGRPGHARKTQAICRWLNHRGHGTDATAWSKTEPTKIDQSVPKQAVERLDAYSSVLGRYGKVIYAFFAPGSDSALTRDALVAMVDLAMEERGILPLSSSMTDFTSIRNQWLSRLLPQVTEDSVRETLKQRRHVILAGPPGTGKTRMARSILKNAYKGNGNTVQFHPNTTYENLIGGLAPALSDSDLGLSFKPRSGYLLQAVKAAAGSAQDYLLHIDEINRADLSKILGEAIFALEGDDGEPREVELAYDFAEIGGRKLTLPDNLHILGTMNTADKSIAPIDLAVRRRFAFVSMWPQLSVVQEGSCELMIEAFQHLLTIFVEHASEEAFDLMPGHSYFLEAEGESAPDRLRTTVGALLREYLVQGYVAGFAPEIRAYLQWIAAQ